MADHSVSSEVVVIASKSFWNKVESGDGENSAGLRTVMMQYKTVAYQFRWIVALILSNKLPFLQSAEQGHSIFATY